MIQSVGTPLGARYRADPRGVGVGARLKPRTVNSGDLLKTLLWISHIDSLEQKARRSRPLR
jgi:hypothetical protein